MTAKRCGIYLRVSDRREQTVENQRTDVETMARARGYEPVVYEETESAAKARPVLSQLLADAHRGRLAAVAVWDLSRLHRSMAATIQTVLELDRLGVPVLSVRDPWLDADGPARSLLVAVFGWVHEQFRRDLIDRTKAGMARARREGKHLGRRHGSFSARPKRDTVAKMREERVSWTAIAKRCKCSVSSARRALAEAA